jgi:hypothetical protein
MLERAQTAVTSHDLGEAWLAIREAQRCLEGERYDIEAMAMDAFLDLNRARAVELANEVAAEFPESSMADCIVEALRRLTTEEMKR